MFDRFYALLLRIFCGLQIVLGAGLIIYWFQIGRGQGQLGAAYLLGGLVMLYLAWLAWRSAEPKKRELSFRERLARRQTNRAKRQPPKGPNPYQMPEDRDA